MNSINKVQLGSNITIGMSAYGNSAVTQQALTSLFSSADGDFELILVDDCSPDDTKSLFLEAKKIHQNTLVFSFDKNKEYTGSLDAILSVAQGDYVIFLSNDIYVTASYLREMLQIAQSNSTYGIVRGCSNYVDNGLATHNIALPENFTVLENLNNFSAKIRKKHSKRIIIDTYLTGDAFLVSRPVIDKIGIFDPLFFGYFADHDYGLRAQIAGFKLILARGAFALHNRDSNFNFLPEDLKQQKLQARWGKVFENWARFKMKFGLPVELPYSSMNNIEWKELSSQTYNRNQHYMSAKEYSRYLI